MSDPYGYRPPAGRTGPGAAGPGPWASDPVPAGLPPVPLAVSHRSRVGEFVDQQGGDGRTARELGRVISGG